MTHKSKSIDVQFCPDHKLFIVCVENPEEIELFANENNIDIPDDKAFIDGLFSKQDNVFHIIFHKDTSHGDMAHEVVHFLNTAYQTIGHELDPDNDEIYCHLVSYFTNACIALHAKYNKV